MRIISFCADGIASAAEKGFFDWALQQDADIICIQNLGAQEYDLQDDLYFPEGYFPYFYDSPHSINGVAIYTPLSSRTVDIQLQTPAGFNLSKGELHIIYLEPGKDETTGLLAESRLAVP